MTKLDRTKSFGIVCGHAYAAFEQDGLLFDGAGELAGTPKTVAADERVVKDSIIQTDALVSATAFLLNILKEGAVTKAVVYKEAGNNNQVWESVHTAAIDMGIHKLNFKGAETWKLPESV